LSQHDGEKNKYKLIITSYNLTSEDEHCICMLRIQRMRYIDIG